MDFLTKFLFGLGLILIPVFGIFIIIYCFIAILFLMSLFSGNPMTEETWLIPGAIIDVIVFFILCYRLGNFRKS